VERRYAAMRDLCNDLRDVRRMLASGTGSRPMPNLQTLLGPKAAAPAAPATGTGTGPITGHQRKFDDEGDGVRPLKMSKEFDNFSATVKLAALTQQTSEFREYITETQKMRAFTGAAPLPSAPAPAPSPSVAPAATRPVTIPRGDITGSQRMPAYGRLPLLPMLILGTLALGVLGLLIVTLVR
jgi:hypothetical protein